MANFFTSFTPGSLRNNFSGDVGFSFIASGNVTVSALGRYKVAGNMGTHAIKLIRSSDNAVLATTSVNNSTGTPDGRGIISAAITPVTLVAGKAYKVVSVEVNGGDQWYDTSSFTYAPGFTFVGKEPNFSANTTYGPVDFTYTTAAYAAVISETFNLDRTSGAPGSNFDSVTDTWTSKAIGPTGNGIDHAAGRSALLSTALASLVWNTKIVGTGADASGCASFWVRLTSYGGGGTLFTLSASGSIGVVTLSNAGVVTITSGTGNTTLALNTWYEITYGWVRNVDAGNYAMQLFVKTIGGARTSVSTRTVSSANAVTSLTISNGVSGSGYYGRWGAVCLGQIDALANVPGASFGYTDPVEAAHYFGIDPVAGDDTTTGLVTPIISGGQITGFTGAPWKTWARTKAAFDAYEFISQNNPWVNAADSSAADLTQTSDALTDAVIDGTIIRNALNDKVIISTAAGVLKVTNSTVTVSQAVDLYGCGSNFGVHTWVSPDGVTRTVDLSNVASIECFKTVTTWALTSGKTNTYESTDTMASAVLWENRKWMTKHAGANYAAVAAALESTAGSYYTDGTKMYVHPFGNTNPGSDGKTYERSNSSSVNAQFNKQTDAYFENFAIGGTAQISATDSTDGLGAYGWEASASKFGMLKNCHVYYYSKHAYGSTNGVSNSRFAYYKCSAAQVAPTVSTSTWVSYVANSGLTGIRHTYDTCYLLPGQEYGLVGSAAGASSSSGVDSDGRLNAFYAHNGGSGSIVSVTHRNCKFDGTITGGGIVTRVIENNIIASGAPYADATLTIRRNKCTYGMIVGNLADTIISDCIFVFPYFFGDGQPSRNGTSFSNTFDRCTLDSAGATVAPSANNPAMMEFADSAVATFNNCAFLSGATAAKLIANGASTHKPVFSYCIFGTNITPLANYNDGSTSADRNFAYIQGTGNMDSGDHSVQTAPNIAGPTYVPTAQTPITNDVGSATDYRNITLAHRRTIGAIEFRDTGGWIRSRGRGLLTRTR